MERHFVSSVYIIEQQRVLLIYHLKLCKWLPPGGHLELNETPSECARREALEETGLVVEFIRQENIWVNQWAAKSFERPYLCLLEEIPAYKDTSQHQHIDFVYLARPIGGMEQQNSAETDGLRWFTLEEVELLELDVEIFSETRQVIRNILTVECESLIEETNKLNK
jgi:ADP-ribose pyrophosphatase YjhB (NUDIX family)